MNGDSSHMIAEIMTAIEKGTLTHSEIERRLEAAIAAEINKKDSSADVEKVRACQSLLWELGTHGKEAFVDDTERSLSAFKAKRAAVKAKRKKHRFALRALAVAAVILIVMFGIDALVYQERLQGAQSPDEQRYTIEGNTVNIGMIAQSNADPSGEDAQVETTDFAVAVAALGYKPPMPQWIPDGWEPLPYYVSKAASNTQFIATYTNSGQEYDLVYQIVYYADAERASIAFEQNTSGKEFVLRDGRTIYVTENYNDTACVWYEGLVCYNLSGPETSDTLLNIIENIKEIP